MIRPACQRLLLVVVALVFASVSANAQGRRLALVIGISSYENPGWDLDLAERDSVAVAEALRKHGNFMVTPLVNPTARLLKLQVEEFAAKIRPGDFVVVYYAGHGVQHRGRNYLLPSDFPAELSRIDETAVSADGLIAHLDEKKPAMKLLILDACRNNPLPGASAGLAPMEPSRQSETRVEFSAAAGQVALDGLYARHLATALSKPGLDVDALFRDVRGAVLAESNQRQMPYTSSALTVNFFFVAPDTALADAERAMALLERTASSMPQGDMGQVVAVESLIRRHHSLNGTQLLRGVALRSGNFSGGDFGAASLAGSDLSDARLGKANFAKADLSFATLRGIAADDANLEGAYLVLADLDCSEPKAPSGCASLRRAKAAGSIWFGATARGVDFSGADLAGARLIYADLRGANFNGAALKGTLFVGSDLRGATFEGATLDKTDFGFARVSALGTNRSGACASAPALGGNAYAHAVRFELFELIPNLTIRGGTEYRRDHLAEFLVQRFWSAALPPCGGGGARGGNWAGVHHFGTGPTLQRDYSVGVEQKLLARSGLRAEIRGRLDAVALRAYPMPEGRFRLTPRTGEWVPTDAISPPANTYLNIADDGNIQLMQEGRTLWSGTIEFLRPPHEISLMDTSSSSLCGEQSRPAIYEWVWQDEKSFTMHVPSSGREPCAARAKLLKGAIFRLESSPPK